MKRKTYVLSGLLLVSIIGISAFWNFYAEKAAAQKSVENLGAAEYNPWSEFALTQGGTNGVWRYGYSASDTDHTFTEFTTNGPPVADCGGAFDRWLVPTAGSIPQIARFSQPVSCSNVPAEALFMHPGTGGERAVLRWTAPAAGTFQLAGVLQRQNSSATTDLKILKNAATPGEVVLFAGSIVSQYQTAFNVTVTVQAGDKLDFSVGTGNGSHFSDGSSLFLRIGQAVTACALPAADLRVNVPGENSPSDVASANTNASLAGDAFYDPGKVGRGFTLDGAGDYVKIEDNAAQRPANALTIEGWFKFDGAPGIVSLVSKPVRNSPFNSYSLYLDGGSLRGLVGSASQYTRVFSNFSPPPGVWHHLAFTYDYSGGVSVLRLYANGVEVTSGQDGTPNLPLFYDASPYPLLIGGEYENNAPGFYLDGQADEVSIYGRALSQSEVFNIVRQGAYGKCLPVPCTPSPDGLVSWHQAEQNALDSRGGNHGANNGAGFAPGKVGQAFSFDGNDLISVSNDASLNPQNITVEAWIKPTSATGLQTIAGKFEHFSGNLSYNLAVDGGNLRWQFNTTNSGSPMYTADATQIFDGQLHHVAATYDGAVSNIYIDGVLVRTDSPNGGALAASSIPLYIGAGRSSGSDAFFFTGLIDEVGIYSRALSISEIQSIINAGASGKCRPSPLNPPAGMRGWWTAGGETADFLGLNPAGVLQGNANYKVGRVGQSFYFDGGGDYVEIADDADQRPATGAVSVEGWFKLESLSNQALPHLVSKPLRNSPYNSYVIYIEGGVLKAGYGSPTQFDELVSGFSPRLNEWHHVAYTIDDLNNVHTLYVNGAPIVAPEATTLPLYFDGIDNALAPHPLVIGGEFENNNPQWQMQGQADEVSLYDRALSTSEVAAIYNAGAAGKLKAKTVNFPPPIGKGVKGRFSAESLLQPAIIELSDATVTFANVTAGGTVSENGIDLAFLPPLPSSVTFTGLAYDISTTAGYQQGSADDVQVCFNIPALQTISFASLRILHLENGAWVNRTAASNTSPNLCTDNLTSLSPFVIVQALAPTAAKVSVSGRVTDANGKGLSNIMVALTDSQGETVYTKTSSFGQYSFTNVAAGEIYIVSVSARRYTFAVSSQAVNVEDAVENVDFTADSGSFRFNSSLKELK